MPNSKLDLNQLKEIEDDDSEELEVNSLFNFLIRNKQILFLFGTSSLLISIITALFSERLWEGEFQIVLSQDNLIKTRQRLQTNETARNLLDINGIGFSNNGIRTEVEILKSPSVLMPIFKYVKEVKSPNNKKTSNLKFKDWRNNHLKVELQRGTNILNINYKDNNKDLIYNVLNKVSKTYQSYSISKRTKNINDGMKYLKDQIAKYKIKSQKSYQTALAYGLENDIRTNIASASESDLLNTEIIRIQAENKLNKTKQLLKRLDQIKYDSEEIKFIAENIRNPDTGQIPFQNDVNNINNLESEIALARLIYTENDQTIIDLESKKNLAYQLLKKKIYGFLNEELKIALITKDKSKRPKEIIFKYKQLVREAQRDEITLNKILNEKNLLALEKARQEKSWDLITNPTVMNNPVAPRRKRIVLLGILFGIGIGSIISLMRELYDGTIYDKQILYKLINAPELMKLSSKNLDSWKDPLFLYSKNFIKRNPNKELLNIVTIGNINKEFINYIKDKIFSNIDKNKLSITINKLDLNKNSIQIIIAQLEILIKKKLIS